MGDEDLYNSSHLVLSNLLLQNSGAKQIPHSNANPCDDGLANYTLAAILTLIASLLPCGQRLIPMARLSVLLTCTRLKHILCASSLLYECFAIFFFKQVKRIAFERFSLLPRLISPGLPLPVCK